MRPISRPSCLYCHRSSCRRMRTPCFYGLRRSLATRSFGRTWCGGAQIGTVLLPLASSTLRCYSIWTDFMLTDTCFPPSRRIGTCSLALHCIASTGHVWLYYTPLLGCLSTCVSISFLYLGCPGILLFSPSSSVCCSRISCQYT